MSEQYSVQTLFGGSGHCEPARDFVQADTRAQQKAKPYAHEIVFHGPHTADNLLCMWTRSRLTPYQPTVR